MQFYQYVLKILSGNEIMFGVHMNGRCYKQRILHECSCFIEFIKYVGEKR